MKVFVYEISHLKNIEYDLTTLINDFKNLELKKNSKKFNNLI